MVRPRHMDMIPAQTEKLGMAEKLAGETHHVGGKGCGKHITADRPGGKKLLDPLHVGIEPHGEHAVGFIENEDFQILQRECPLEEVVENAPRRPHDELHSLPEGIELRAVFHAAIHRSRSHLEIAAEEFCFAGDLKGQLTGGYEDQDLASFLRHINPLQDRQDECPCLSAPRL